MYLRECNDIINNSYLPSNYFDVAFERIDMNKDYMDNWGRGVFRVKKKYNPFYHDQIRSNPRVRDSKMDDLIIIADNICKSIDDYLNNRQT